jgi:hypothetical protein
MALLLSSAWPAGARAQDVRLDLRDGLVWLSARDASVEAIVSEWSRVGGVVVSSSGPLAETRLTLELEGVSEAHFVDAILGREGGYVLTERPPGSASPSRYGRVLILAGRRSPGPASALAEPSPPSLVSLPPPLPEPAAPESLEEMPSESGEAGSARDPLFDAPAEPASAESPKEALHVVPIALPNVVQPKEVLMAAPPVHGAPPREGARPTAVPPPAALPQRR